MAAAEGVHRNLLGRLVAAGHLRRPVRGTYAAVQAGDSLALRASCLRLVSPLDAVVCDRHAGWLHGAEMILAPGEHLALEPVSMFLPSGRGRLRNDLANSGERNFIESDLTVVDGLVVTTPLRTACDLGRLLRRDQAVAALDALLRLGVFSKEDLLVEVKRLRRMRWVTQLRALAPLADGRAESPGESVLRLRWIDFGLPTPQPQVEVFRDGRLIARLDVGNEEMMFAAEYDGAEWHESPEQQAHDSARRLELDQEFDWTIRALTQVNIFGLHQDCEAILREGATEARRLMGRRVVW